MSSAVALSNDQTSQVVIDPSSFWSNTQHLAQLNASPLRQNVFPTFDFFNDASWLNSDDANGGNEGRFLDGASGASFNLFDTNDRINLDLPAEPFRIDMVGSPDLSSQANSRNSSPISDSSDGTARSDQFQTPPGHPFDRYASVNGQIDVPQFYGPSEVTPSHLNQPNRFSRNLTSFCETVAVESTAHVAQIVGKNGKSLNCFVLMY